MPPESRNCCHIYRLFAYSTADRSARPAAKPCVERARAMTAASRRFINALEWARESVSKLNAFHGHLSLRGVSKSRSVPARWASRPSNDCFVSRYSSIPRS